MISNYSIFGFPLATILLHGWYPSIQYLGFLYLLSYSMDDIPLFNICVSSIYYPTLWMISNYSIFGFRLATILLYGLYTTIQYLGFLYLLFYSMDDIPLFNIWVSSNYYSTLRMISLYSIFRFPLGPILLYGFYPSIQYLGFL